MLFLNPYTIFAEKYILGRNMPKKYHVFISTAQDDLRAERRELIRIVTELGAIPVTMDAFDITDENDCRIIRKSIDECDYFINITAYKGGAAIGKSFTLEYEYLCALKAKVPVMALVINEKARWKAAKKDKKEEALKALEGFKTKLENHPCEKWMNISDLKQKALFLLTREMNLNPRRGWAPSTEVMDASVANEMSRLIRENETLKNETELEENEIIKKLKEQIKNTIRLLSNNRISISFYYTDGEKWENPSDFRYIRLFKLLAPELRTAKTVTEITHFLGNILNPDLQRIVRKNFPAPSNTIKKIMSDFTLLKLVKSKPSIAVNGMTNGEEWEMTEYGKEILAAYRIRQMKRAARTSGTGTAQQPEQETPNIEN